mmetsp:Transcript_136711/g.437325  ORF Transcript_136711/g.437325 Transcript_136711/m.437325 type:complete len:142 (+) Transcript_136711:297-722(+)
MHDEKRVVTNDKSCLRAALCPKVAEAPLDRGAPPHAPTVDAPTDKHSALRTAAAEAAEADTAPLACCASFASPESAKSRRRPPWSSSSWWCSTTTVAPGSPCAKMTICEGQIYKHHQGPGHLHGEGPGSSKMPCEINSPTL